MKEKISDEFASYPTSISSLATPPEIILSPLPPSFKVVSSIPLSVVMLPGSKEKRKEDGNF